MFPLSRDGRQTLVHLVFAGAGPATSAMSGWAMMLAYRAERWDTFANLAMVNAAGNLIIVTALAMAVSIRAIKISAKGFEADGQDATRG